MRYTEQEPAARTTTPQPQYDCILPPVARDLLNGRKQSKESVQEFARRHGFPVPQPERFKWRQCVAIALGAILGTLLLGQGFGGPAPNWKRPWAQN